MVSSAVVISVVLLWQLRYYYNAICLMAIEMHGCSQFVQAIK